MSAQRLTAATLLLLLGACSYDDTPMMMKIIDGETGRKLYARTLLQAAETLPGNPTPPSAEQIEAIESAYADSQHAYAEVLRCHDEGVCRMGSMRDVCTDVAALLEARRALAPYSDLISLAEMLSSNRGPMNADRLRLLQAEARRDGKVSELEESVLTLATAAAAAHAVWSLTPEGEKERLARRRTHAIDEFKQRCDADAA
jgi:hypothetical protein